MLLRQWRWLWTWKTAPLTSITLCDSPVNTVRRWLAAVCLPSRTCTPLGPWCERGRLWPTPPNGTLPYLHYVHYLYFCIFILYIMHIQDTSRVTISAHVFHKKSIVVRKSMCVVPWQKKLVWRKLTLNCTKIRCVSSASRWKGSCGQYNIYCMKAASLRCSQLQCHKTICLLVYSEDVSFNELSTTVLLINVFMVIFSYPT